LEPGANLAQSLFLNISQLQNQRLDIWLPQIVRVSVVDDEHLVVADQKRPTVSPVYTLTRVGIQYGAVSKRHSAVK
jgi:hypothetical protein